MEPYSKEQTDKFWKFVKYICWDPAEHNADTLKSALLREITPQNADLYHLIAQSYISELYMKYYTEYSDKSKLGAGLANIIGAGEKEYIRALKSDKAISAAYDTANVMNSFIDIIPTADDYFSNPSELEY